jgi:hypothetical protein
MLSQEQKDRTPIDIYKLPCKYEKDGQMIFDADGKLMLDVRGWGYIQYLKPDPEKMQDDFGNYIAKVINEHLDKDRLIEDLSEERDSFRRECLRLKEDVVERDITIQEKKRELIPINTLKDRIKFLEGDKGTPEFFKLKEAIKFKDARIKALEEALRDAYEDASGAIKWEIELRIQKLLNTL